MTYNIVPISTVKVQNRNRLFWFWKLNWSHIREFLAFRKCTWNYLEIRHKVFHCLKYYREKHIYVNTHGEERNKDIEQIKWHFNFVISETVWEFFALFLQLFRMKVFKIKCYKRLWVFIHSYFAHLNFLKPSEMTRF